ncbi:MAG: chemotaxis protein CheW [Spirochaetaceae bacterium]|nr:chemotaxis protein CheW [Spirochaetaceae bacterium]
MRGLSLLSEGELFTVDVTLVQKIIRNMAFTPVPAAPPAVVGIANIKGGIVTVLSLAELLGRKRNMQAVNAVVFKSFTDGNDQMGLLVDHPGDLIDIEENEILPPPLSEEGGEKYCISGMAEVKGKLYRIINIDEIISRFNDGNESSINTNTITQGGLDNEEKI